MTDKNVESGVVPEPTTEQITEVIKQQQVASLAQLKLLPQIRKANAVPFQIPGTEFVVKIAPCTVTDAYKAIVSELKTVDIEDDEERIANLRTSANALIKACVVEPELDDEAVNAINDFNANALGDLITECKKISGLDKPMSTTVSEAFS